MLLKVPPAAPARGRDDGDVRRGVAEGGEVRSVVAPIASRVSPARPAEGALGA